MKKCEVIISWVEPRDWIKHTLNATGEKMPSVWRIASPFLLGAFVIFYAALSYARRTEKSNELIIELGAGISVLLAMLGLYALILRAKTLYLANHIQIRADGIQTGKAFGQKQWYPYTEIEGFHITHEIQDEIPYHSFEWLPQDAQYTNIAVLPNDVNRQQLRSILVSKGLEELNSDGPCLMPHDL